MGAKLIVRPLLCPEPYSYGFVSKVCKGVSLMKLSTSWLQNPMSMQRMYHWHSLTTFCVFLCSHHGRAAAWWRDRRRSCTLVFDGCCGSFVKHLCLQDAALGTRQGHSNEASCENGMKEPEQHTCGLTGQPFIDLYANSWPKSSVHVELFGGKRSVFFSQSYWGNNNEQHIQHGNHLEWEAQLWLKFTEDRRARL